VRLNEQGSSSERLCTYIRRWKGSFRFKGIGGKELGSAWVESNESDCVSLCDEVFGGEWYVEKES